MKIQVKPWDISETSLRVPVTKRRRKRSSSRGSGGEKDDHHVTANNPLLVPNCTASFVTSSSSQQLKRKSLTKRARFSNSGTSSTGDATSGGTVGESFQPSLILTSDHRVSVFGIEKGSTAGTERNASSIPVAGPLHPRLSESSVLQHMSRPGPSTAFCSDGCCKIPSLLLLDQRHHHHRRGGGIYRRGYVFTERNQRLVSWSSTNSISGGIGSSVNIDGCEQSDSVKLNRPAVSMSFLNVPATNSPVIYGSCEDGSVYFARLISLASERNKQGGEVDKEGGGSSWSVEYLDSPREKLGGSCCKHLGTIAEYDRDTNSTASATAPGSNKRKVAASSSKTTNKEARRAHSIRLYQVFLDGTRIVLIRRQVNLILSQDQDARHIIDVNITERRLVQSASIPLIQTNHTISSAQFLGLVKEDSCIALAFGVDADRSGRVKKYYYACISLQHARICRAPVFVGEEFSSGSSCSFQFGLVGPAVVAALNQNRNELLLFDRVRGGLLHQKSVEDLLTHDDVNSTDNMTLVTDAEQPRMAILLLRNDVICIATSSLDAGISLRNRFSLNAGLSAATGEMFQTSGSFVGRSLSLQPNADSDSNELVEAAAKLLQSALEEIRKGSKKSRKKSYLMDAYELSVSSLNSSIETISGSSADNPQEAFPSRSSEDKINGVHPSAEKGEITMNGGTEAKMVNGQHLSVSQAPSSPELRPPQSLPRAFIYPSLSVVLEILQLPEAVAAYGVKNDASCILKRLVHSGKVSARNQLQPGVFTQLLLSLDRASAATGAKLPYSAIEISFDLYQFCPDVSEHQMVLMVHYFLSCASTDGLAAYFLRLSKSLDLPESVSSLIKAYTRLGGKRKRSERDEKNLSKLLSRLAVSGTTALLETITSYSDFNESLLTAAIGKVLSRREMTFLNRILADILTGSDYFVSPHLGGGRRRLLQWISALNQALNGARSEAESADLSYMCKLVHNEVLKTERMLSLQGVVKESIAVAYKGGPNRHVQEKPAVVSEKKASEQIPPYQIERLVF